MKACPMCGLEAAPEATECSGCQYKFTSVVLDTDYLETIAPSDRPTGAGPITAGWGCLLLGIALVILSLSEPTDTYNASLAVYARQWIFQMAAAGAISLAVLLWCVGYIVKAISFLPGRGES